MAAIKHQKKTVFATQTKPAGVLSQLGVWLRVRDGWYHLGIVLLLLLLFLIGFVFNMRR